MTAGLVLFATYALVQVTQMGDASAAFDIYDSDNYPQVSQLWQLPCCILPQSRMNISKHQQGEWTHKTAIDLIYTAHPFYSSSSSRLHFAQEMLP